MENAYIEKDVRFGKFLYPGTHVEDDAEALARRYLHYFNLSAMKLCAVYEFQV